jgi:hypothetical protein
MAALAALVPSFLRRRKRSAEEDELRALRGALRGVDRAAVEDKCLELYAANRTLAQRSSELERAAGARMDACAMVRAAVRDELARAPPAKVARWTFCALGDSEPSSDADDDSDGTDSEDTCDSEEDEDDDDDALPPDISADALQAQLQSEDAEVRPAARMHLLAQMRSEDSRVVAAARKQMLASLQSEDKAARPAERQRLLAMTPEELQAEHVNEYAVSAHQPEAQAWRKDAVPGIATKECPRYSTKIRFLNLRPEPVEVLWVNDDGDDQACPNKSVVRSLHNRLRVARLSCASLCLTRPQIDVDVGYSTYEGHRFRIYDVPSGEFLGGVCVMDTEYEYESSDDALAALERPLRLLFGFDGFVGPSLRAAVEAFDAKHFVLKDPTQQLFVIA